MRRRTIHTLFFSLFLHFLLPEAQGFNFESLPPTITVSRTINVNWDRPKQFESTDLVLELIYPVGPSVTQILTTYEITQNEPGIEKGSVAIIATATGNLKLVAAKLKEEDGDKQPDHEAFFTTYVQAVADTGKPSVTGTATVAATITLTTTETATSTKDASVAATDYKGIIIPSIIGGFIVLLVVSILLMFLCRHRRRRDAPSDEFRRDMMVLTRVNSVPSADHSQPEYPRKEKTSVTAEESRNLEVDSISSSREKSEGDEGDRSSLSASVYTRTSAGTRTLAASAISGKSAASSNVALDIAPSLIPVSINSPLSPFNFQVPSRARTDRQMQVEEKIIEVQGRLIVVGGSEEKKGRTRAMLLERIEKLKDLRESVWANGGKGEVPEALID
ncbi:hypothetical protein PM082_009566 [Marasmius tenuissimus]|nr:hypothetical protein PM082_009566 [Marasmius tenuissimus]